jgi:hypothetical protein
MIIRSDSIACKMYCFCSDHLSPCEVAYLRTLKLGEIHLKSVSSSIYILIADSLLALFKQDRRSRSLLSSTQPPPRRLSCMPLSSACYMSQVAILCGARATVITLAVHGWTLHAYSPGVDETKTLQAGAHPRPPDRWWPLSEENTRWGRSHLFESFSAGARGHSSDVKTK